MAEMTIQEFAKVVGIPEEKLKKQLNDAGLGVSGNKISEAQKEALYAYLKQDHGGSDTQSELKPKKIVLNRKSTREIKVTRATGQRSTINIVRKSRRTYVKADQQSESTPQVKEDVIEAPIVVEDPPKSTTPAPTPSQPQDEKTEKAEKTEQTEKTDKTDKTKKKEKPKKTKSGKPRAEPKRKKPLIKEIGGSTEEIENLRNRRRQKAKTRAKGDTLLISKQAFEKPVEAQVYEVLIPETTTASELAENMSVKAAVVIKELMKLGVMATINQPIDQDTAILVVEEMGHRPKLIEETSLEDALHIEYDEVEMESRAPVITVMGHVDHGKTSLLDQIRRTQVSSEEAGGITQHIGAYHVTAKRGDMTFLDTPGHAAFTAMRARGAQCTDVVVLVVAADDGVKPQTLEAISHAQAAKVPIVVAINKIDKPDADPEQIKNAVSQHGLVPEDWGGDTIFVPVSAKEGTGIADLLDAILLQAEILELKASKRGLAKGTVLEARIDKGQGPVASFLVQSGTLNQGDTVLAGLHYGRVRALTNDLGEKLKQAGPSIPVEVLGLSGVPNAGDEFVSVMDERKAREIALFRQGKYREVKLASQKSVKLEGFLDGMQPSDHKVLNIVLKTDVQGSAEALTHSLTELSNEAVKVHIVSNSVGGINESDVNLALASNAVLIGFNVRADAKAKRVAQTEQIELNYFSVIYDVVDNVKRAISGLTGPSYKEEIIGVATVKEVFRSSKLGAIAGCMVMEGTMKRGLPIRVLRDNVVIFEGELESLRRFKDEVKEVKSGTECGLGVKNYNDVRVEDQIEVYEKTEVRPTF